MLSLFLLDLVFLLQIFLVQRLFEVPSHNWANVYLQQCSLVKLPELASLLPPPRSVFDDPLLVLCPSLNTIRLYDATTGSSKIKRIDPLINLLHHKISSVSGLLMLPDGRKLVSAGGSVINVWDLANQKGLLRIRIMNETETWFVCLSTTSSMKFLSHYFNAPHFLPSACFMLFLGLQLRQ